MSDRPIIEPFVLTYNEKEKMLSKYTVKNDKPLSMIKEFFYDQEAVKNILEKGEDPMIYSYHDHNQPEVEGEFSFGITVINPGTIGDQFYMTRGHFHGGTAGEFYMGLEGKGIVIMENHKTGEAKPYFFTRNSLPYIPSGYGHRVVNIGDEPLVFLTVEAAKGSHDYDRVREDGFGILVLKDPNSESGYKVVPNPKRST